MTRVEFLRAEAKLAEIRATYHDYYGRLTAEYYAEMDFAAKLRRLADLEEINQRRIAPKGVTGQ